METSGEVNDFDWETRERNNQTTQILIVCICNEINTKHTRSRILSGSKNPREIPFDAKHKVKCPTLRPRSEQKMERLGSIRFGIRQENSWFLRRMRSKRDCEQRRMQIAQCSMFTISRRARSLNANAPNDGQTRCTWLELIMCKNKLR